MTVGEKQIAFALVQSMTPDFQVIGIRLGADGPDGATGRQAKISIAEKNRLRVAGVSFEANEITQIPVV